MTAINKTMEQRIEEFIDKRSRISAYFSSEEHKEIPIEVSLQAEDVAEKLSNGCICNCSPLKLIDLLEGFDEKSAQYMDLFYINKNLGEILSAIQ